MRYFIPEWDDLIDDKYDFWNDRPLPNAKKVYAHEIFENPNYDGILVSRVKLLENKSKLQQIYETGIHSFLRFNGPVFGDCGAWGYINEDKPPFKTKETIEYYEKTGVNYGVSIDHLCAIPDEKVKRFRHKLTIKNAERFYQVYNSDEYSFCPVGACQGYNPETYYESVKEILDIGYDYIALGGLARAPTNQIIEILKNIQDLIQGKNIDLHIFGVARLEAVRIFRSLGVTSIDSASPLRSAWLGSEKNYRTMKWEGYSAIRLPFLSKTKRYIKEAAKQGIGIKELKEFEDSLFAMLRRFEFEKNRTPEEIAEAFEMLNKMLDLGRDRQEDYIRTLRDRPWEKCPCTICKNCGMDVIIFRGNNRNRRRGFHNTYVFYQLLQKLLNDDDFELPEVSNSSKKVSKTTKQQKEIKNIPSLNLFFKEKHKKK